MESPYKVYSPRTLTPDLPVPPTATIRELAAWVTYINTRYTDTMYGKTTHRADVMELRHYIVKADRHLRAIGIWTDTTDAAFWKRTSQ